MHDTLLLLITSSIHPSQTNTTQQINNPHTQAHTHTHTYTHTLTHVDTYTHVYTLHWYAYGLYSFSLNWVEKVRCLCIYIWDYSVIFRPSWSLSRLTTLPIFGVISVYHWTKKISNRLLSGRVFLAGLSGAAWVWALGRDQQNASHLKARA